MAEHVTHSYAEGPYTPEQKTADFSEHQSTYAVFITLSKWSIGIVAVILIGLYVFLV